MAAHNACKPILLELMVMSIVLRMRAKKGKKTAYVAVARKMLTVIWHLLVNGELYVEEGFSKAARKRGLVMRAMFLWKLWLKY